MNSEMVRFNQLTGYLEPFPRQIHELARKTRNSDAYEWKWSFATFFVSTAEVIVDGFLFSAAWNDVIIEFAPPTVAFRIDKYNVMSTMVIATVDKNSVQRISRRYRFRSLNIRLQIELLVKLEPNFKIQTCLP